jgi:hypothetical protein
MRTTTLSDGNSGRMTTLPRVVARAQVNAGNPILVRAEFLSAFGVHPTDVVPGRRDWAVRVYFPGVVGQVVAGCDQK